MCARSRAAAGLLIFLAGAGSADTLALVVGVEHYRHPEISPVPFAVADAVALRQALLSPGVARLDPDNVVSLTSDSTGDRSPTRTNLLIAYHRQLLALGPDDTLLVYFAGHGVEVDGGQYLLPVDTDPLLLTETALPVRLLRDLAGQSAAREVVFILDACRNQPLAARGDEDNLLGEAMARDLRPRLLDPTVDGGPGPAVAALLACDTGERAWGWPEEGHGVFTRFLLQGLAGEASRSGADETVSLIALADYVAASVPPWAAARGRRQSPQLINPQQIDPVLARPRPVSRLVINSEPDGATVRLNGKTVGLTPLTWEVTGTETLTIVGELEGYQPSSLSLTTRPGETSYLTIALQPQLAPAPFAAVAVPPAPLEPGFLGVELRSLDSITAREEQAWPWVRSLRDGALVSLVLAEGPAEGLLSPGAVVVRCDDELIESPLELQDLVRQRGAGSEVRLLVIDERGRRPVRITLDPAMAPLQFQILR